MRRWIPVVILACLFTLACPAMAWDGDWTQARSGDDLLYDDGNSDGKAGTDETPQTYFIPPVREYRDVDPEELEDYASDKHYSPYALARIERDLLYNGLMIPKGYYLIKAGDASDGSPAVNLQTQPATAMLPVAMGASPPVDPALTPDGSAHQNTWLTMQAGATVPAGRVQRTAPVQASADTKTERKKPADDPGYQVLVFKKLGRVVAVIPIHRKQAYKPPKDADLHKMRGREALVWVDIESYHPVLNFYHHRVLYSTDFE